MRPESGRSDRLGHRSLDVPPAQPHRLLLLLQDEVPEERGDLSNHRADALVVGRVVIPDPPQERGKVQCIRSEATVVGHVRTTLHGRAGTGVVEVEDPASAEHVDYVCGDRLTLRQVLIQPRLPLTATEPVNPGGGIVRSLESDLLLGEDDLVAGSADQSGAVAVRRELEIEDDLVGGLRTAVQQGRCPAPAADVESQVLVHDPTQQLKRRDEVALARPVRTDEQIEVPELDRGRADGQEALDGDGLDLAGHGPTLRRRAGPTMMTRWTRCR